MPARQRLGNQTRTFSWGAGPIRPGHLAYADRVTARRTPGVRFQTVQSIRATQPYFLDSFPVIRSFGLGESRAWGFLGPVLRRPRAGATPLASAATRTKACPVPS